VAAVAAVTIRWPSGVGVPSQLQTTGGSGGACRTGTVVVFSPGVGLGPVVGGGEGRHRYGRHGQQQSRRIRSRLRKAVCSNFH